MNILKVGNEDTRTTSGASTVNFEHILHFTCIYTIIAEFEQMLLGTESIKFKTINLFSVTVRNILFYGLGTFVRLYVFILIHPK